MRRMTSLLALAVLLTAGLAVTFTATAGEGHKCTGSAQDCLNGRAAKLAQHGWLGLETAKNDWGGYTVEAVTPESPAADAGFRPGDVLVALNGVALEEKNHEALKQAKSQLGVGKQVRYTVKRDGQKRELTATLAPVPREVLAQWVGEHMLEHHVTTTLAQAN